MPGFTPVPSDPSGPPPPPWERDRRRRRRRVVIAAMAVVLGLVGVALFVPGLLDGSADDPPEAVEEPDEPDDEVPDSEPGEADPPPSDEDLPVPDVAGLDGADAVFGQLLVDIDASERAMIAFQDGLQQAFADAGLGDTDDLIASIQAAAQEGVARLADVRARIDDSLEHDGAEAVRVVYVDHLDAWVRYMAAVDERPSLLDPEVDSERYTLSINTSAETFARTLEQELPDDIASEVQAFAEGILDRGFRIEMEPQV